MINSRPLNTGNAIHPITERSSGPHRLVSRFHPRSTHHPIRSTIVQPTILPFVSFPRWRRQTNFFFFFLLRRKENESIGSTISLEAWRNHALVANFILFPTGFGSLSTVTPTPLSIEQKESFFTLTKSPYLDKFSNSKTKRNDSFAKRDFSVQRVRNKRGTRAHRWRAIVRLFIIKFPISPRLST